MAPSPAEEPGQSYKIESVIRPITVDYVRKALMEIGVTGMTTSNAQGYGKVRVMQGWSKVLNTLLISYQKLN